MNVGKILLVIMKFQIKQKLNLIITDMLTTYMEGCYISGNICIHMHIYAYVCVHVFMYMEFLGLTNCLIIEGNFGFSNQAMSHGMERLNHGGNCHKLSVRGYIKLDVSWRKLGSG